MQKRTFIYIDGFNLYYRLKETSYKWLNLEALFLHFLNKHQHNVLKIKYFTALVKRQSSIHRQHLYLRALKTIPNLEIIYGQFKERQVKGILCDYKNGELIKTQKLVTVNKWEEKESDVNIATHIVADAYQDKYKYAVLLSNDTDLKTPLEHIKSLERKIGLITPLRKAHDSLKNICHFHKHISNNTLKKCQFPEILKDDKGEFSRPKEWQ